MKSHAFEESYFQEVYGGNYYHRNPAYKWRSFLRQIIKYKGQGQLLDIGCGLGLFLKQACLAFECTGCDISSYALDQARKNIPKSVPLFQCSLGEISSLYPFDVITCFDILEHVEDLDAGWNNIINLLNPGGILTFSVPVYDGPIGRLVDYLDHDLTHIHRRERKFWHEEVNKYFQVLSSTGIWRYFFFNRYYIHLLSSSTQRWSPAILIIAKKV